MKQFEKALDDLQIEYLLYMPKSISYTSVNNNIISRMANIVPNISKYLSNINKLSTKNIDIISKWFREAESSTEFLVNDDFLDNINLYVDSITRIFAKSNPNNGTKPISSSDEEFLRTISSISRFRLPFQKDISTSTKLLEVDKSSFFESHKLELEHTINVCYFDSCAWTEADNYFLKLWKERPEESLEILATIANTNLDNEHIMEGVIHILASLPYSEIPQTGISICLACCFNRSPVVIDQLISCFENWGDPEGIKILKTLDLSATPWLANYCNDVIEMLEEKKV